MANKSGKNALLVIGVTAVLLLISLIGNVVLLSLLKNTDNKLYDTKLALTEAEYLLAQYKSGAQESAEPAAEPGEPEDTEEPAKPAEPAAVTGDGTEKALEESTAEPTEKPTPKPTATPEPTPAGPYAGSALDYEPLDSENLPEVKKAIVSCTVDVNVRSGPGTNYKKLASVASGSEIKTVASAYGWFLIEYKNKTYGWISGQYFFGDWMFENGLNSFLKDIDPAKEFLSGPETVVVTAENGANARCGAATAKELVKRLENGDTGVCLAYEDDWRLCNFQGVYCWVHKSNFA